MLVQTINGSETFPGSSCKISLFTCGPKGGEQTPMFVVAKDDRHPIQTLNSEYVNAMEGSTNHKGWYKQRYDIPGGHYIRVWVQRRVRGQGFGYNSYCFFLRIRAEAAYQRVRIKLTQDIRAAMSYGYIEGRFDVIPPNRFKTLGLDVDDAFIDHYNWDEDDNVIDFQIIESEISSYKAPKIKKLKTASGQVVRGKQSARKRRLNIRRR